MICETEYIKFCSAQRGCPECKYKGSRNCRMLWARDTANKESAENLITQLKAFRAAELHRMKDIMPTYTQGFKFAADAMIKITENVLKGDNNNG